MLLAIGLAIFSFVRWCRGHSYRQLGNTFLGLAIALNSGMTAWGWVAAEPRGRPIPHAIFSILLAINVALLVAGAYFTWKRDAKPTST